MQKETISTASHATAKEFSERVQLAMKRSQETGRPFLVILLQLANMAAFRAQRPNHVVVALLRELLASARKAVHPNQYVGIMNDGLGLVFEGIDSGQADVLGRKLVMLATHVIKTGRYNDLSSRWSEIIYQFLWPNKPGIIYPCVGWAVYPRDGVTGHDLVKRAFHHLAELRR